MVFQQELSCIVTLRKTTEYVPKNEHADTQEQAETCKGNLSSQFQRLYTTRYLNLVFVVLSKSGECFSIKTLLKENGQYLI